MWATNTTVLPFQTGASTDQGVDREAMVVGGDLDLAGSQILDQLVDAVGRTGLT